MNKNKIIGALAMLALLTVPALIGKGVNYLIGDGYLTFYITAFVTTISVMVAYSIIEYLKSVFKK